MRHIFVNSSNLWSVAYDVTTETMEIRFRSGGIYQYYGVPSNLYAGLMNANSHGKFFHAFIRGGYGDTKVGQEKSIMLRLQKPGETPIRAGRFQEVGPLGGRVANPRIVTITPRDKPLPPTQRAGHRWERIGPAK